MLLSLTRGEYSTKKGLNGTVCPGSSDPPEKIFNIFVSGNEVYTITITILQVEYYSLQIKRILGHMN